MGAGKVKRNEMGGYYQNGLYLLHSVVVLVGYVSVGFQLCSYSDRDR